MAPGGTRVCRERAPGGSRCARSEAINRCPRGWGWAGLWCPCGHHAVLFSVSPAGCSKGRRKDLPLTCRETELSSFPSPLDVRRSLCLPGVAPVWVSGSQSCCQAGRCRVWSAAGGLALALTLTRRGHKAGPFEGVLAGAQRGDQSLRNLCFCFLSPSRKMAPLPLGGTCPLCGLKRSPSLSCLEPWSVES